MRNPFRRQRTPDDAGPWAAAPLASLTVCVIDCETTGLHPRHGDRIVSLGAVRIGESSPQGVTEFETLVNPGSPIPVASTLIHGLDDVAVAEAPGQRDAVDLLREFVGDQPLVGHQVSFDLAFLVPIVRRADLQPLPPALDTMLLSAVLWPKRGTPHGLDAVAQRLGVDVQGRHTALGDARATADIYVRMVPMLRQRSIVTFGEALAVSRSTGLARHLDSMYP